MKLNLNFLKTIFTISLITLYFNSTSQNWPKIFGDNIIAYGQEIIGSYDEGYLIRGSILRDPSHFKFGWIIKTDINGNVIWDKKFGDPFVENFFLDFDRTSDHGLIISGATAQQDVERDPLFIKLDPCGEIEWCKIFISDHDNTATGIVAMPNGEYLGMLQYYGGDAQHIRISLVKMDADGEPIWIKHLANEDSTLNNEEGQFLNILNDGNYLVSGYCFSPSIKPFFIKTDIAGEQLWDIRWPVGLGGSAGQSAFSSNGVIYNASHLLFTGHPKVPYLLKFNESGEVIDQYPLMGDTIENGGAKSLLLYDNSTLFIGLTWTDDPTYYTGYCDIFITDTLGNLFSQRRLIDDNNPPTCIIKDNYNKIITIGTFAIDDNWDIYMWKMNSDLEDDTLYTQPLTYDSLCPYQILSDTVDLDCSLFVNIDEIPTKEEYESSIKISPNPARDWITLTLPENVASGAVGLAIYNIFGQEVMRKEAVLQNRMIALNISSLSSGLYFVVSKDDRNNILKGKFIKALY